MPFHPGEIEAQIRAGGATQGSGIRSYLTEPQRGFFAALPFVAVALEDRGWPVATILEGAPGFVAAPGPRTLRIAARPAPSDPAATALFPGRPAGVLGIDLATRRRNRANGAIASVEPEGFTLALDEAFGNCPRYIHPRVLGRALAAPSATERLDGLDDAGRDMVASADTFFIATGDRDRGLDMSHRGGPAGFAHVDGETLTIDDYEGNRYFNTFGNLVLNPRAALLFVDFERGDVLHLQARSEIAWGAERRLRLHVRGGWRRRGALSLRLSGADPETRDASGCTRR